MSSEVLDIPEEYGYLEEVGALNVGKLGMEREPTQVGSGPGPSHTC